MKINELISKLQAQDFSISTAKDKLQIDIIHGFLKEAYWSKGVPREIIEKAISNSFTFGVYHQTNQIGFARLITDFAVFAHLADVFILDDYRGRGLSKWLLFEIRHHPELQTLKKWTLATVDAHGLYKQFGFSEITNPKINMEISNPGKYT